MNDQLPDRTVLLIILATLLLVFILVILIGEDKNDVKKIFIFNKNKVKVLGINKIKGIKPL